MEQKELRPDYEKLRDVLRELYHKSEILTPELMNEFNHALWIAEHTPK